MAKTQTRRTDTRQRIQDVALELFLDSGYDQTSLREIAERLEVTKAALYYHFKTKEDIVVALVERLTAPMDDLIAWAETQPRTAETRMEMLGRLTDALVDAEQIIRFMQENQAALRALSVGESFKTRMHAMSGLLSDDDAGLVDRIRAIGALFTVYFGTFASREFPEPPEEKRAALLQVAGELLSAGDVLPASDAVARA
ncbi:helix-turn-helix domain-containing protein [Actinomadura barringtoniae]|uniref:helix-turn-helix domain-containing protein n=1 Tax=Actinomadura barringtoniae TaxID=1427535 RepID=UPI0027DC6365|nr:helix-turn-helix domain-containing protein [Actinomadura barringtoniae]